LTVPEKLQAIIRWVMRDVTYHKHYLCTVQKQVGTNVDLVPDDPEIRGSGLQGVPLDTIPGVAATVAPGARMTLYFDGGNPSKPRAVWVSGAPITLSFADGVLPVARVGDTVTVSPVGLLDSVGAPVTGVATGTIVAGAPKVLA